MRSVRSPAATPILPNSAPARSPAFEPRSRFAANQKSQPERSPNSWDQIWQQVNRRRDQERSRTSRGDICPVVPQFIERRVIWRDRPIFVWQGKVETITVSELGTPSRSLWQQQLNQQTAIVYAGDPLKPGTQYLWQAQTGTQSTQVIFQTLGQAERDRITAQLQQLETRLATAKLAPEATVRHRMQFFLDQNLWLDAMQEAYTVTQPSAALQRFQRRLVNLYCRQMANPD